MNEKELNKLLDLLNKRCEWLFVMREHLIPDDAASRKVIFRYSEEMKLIEKLLSHHGE
jgi:hypothetical protein